MHTSVIAWDFGHLRTGLRTLTVGLEAVAFGFEGSAPGFQGGREPGPGAAAMPAASRLLSWASLLVGLRYVTSVP